MNPFRLLFSFRGRIGRVAYVFGLLLAVALLGLIVWGPCEALAAGAQAVGGTGLNAASLQTGIWTIAGLLTTWMLLAVTVAKAPSLGVMAAPPVPLPSVACSIVQTHVPVRAPFWGISFRSPASQPSTF